MSSLIHYIVQEALQSGQLSPQAELQIQRLLQRGCDIEDIEALTQLQQAVAIGTVKRIATKKGNFLFGDR